MRQNIKKQKGSIFKGVLMLGAFILLLSYFGFDLKSFIESDSVKNNFSFIWDFISEFGNNYLADYFFIFGNYVKPLLGPATDKITESGNILEFIKDFKIPEPASIMPEIISIESLDIEA